MNRSPILMLFFVLASGCQTQQLRLATVTQAHTINDLYTDQIMNNLAMLAAHPAALPYFSVPDAGQNSTQYSIGATYTPGWDFISSAGKYLGRYLFDKQTATINGSDANIEQWTTGPTTDPDKLILLRYAFEAAFGDIPESHLRDLQNVLQFHMPITGRGKPGESSPIARSNRFGPISGFSVDYMDLLHTGWFSIGTKHDVPKNACYVGRCGKTYAWVMPDHAGQLSDFTLVVLDIATLYNSYRKAAPNTGRQAQGLYATGF